MSSSVALGDTWIGRPRSAVAAEVVVAGPARRTFPTRLSDTVGICLKTSGPSHLTTADGRRRAFGADEVCVRLPGCVWSSNTEQNGFVSIDVPAEFVEGRVRYSAMRFGSARALPQFRSAVAAVLNTDSELEAAGLLVELIASVSDTGGLALAVDRPPPGTVHRARALVHDRLAERISLDDMADCARVSKFTLVRAFRRHVGITPYAYVMLARVARARELLASDTPPSEAALAAGFADQAHLTRLFRRVYGLTPASYRHGQRPDHVTVPHERQFCSRRSRVQLRS